jgi:hypothetical protein
VILKKKRVSILNVLLILDAFVLGGFVTLLLVNRLLDIQLNGYAARSTAATKTIVDLMDNLLAYYAAYAGIFLLLILLTLGVWTWRMVGDPMVAKDHAHAALSSRADDNPGPPIITQAGGLL